jgi:hypothetical protein
VGKAVGLLLLRCLLVAALLSAPAGITRLLRPPVWDSGILPGEGRSFGS